MSTIRAVLFCVLFASSQALANETPFEEALRAIVGRDTQLETARSNLEAARARSHPTLGAYLPTISADTLQTTSREGVPASSTTRALQGTARLNLFRFGADMTNWQAARSDLDTANAGVEQAKLRAEASGVALIVSSIQRTMEIDVLERIAKSREELLAIARERYKKGLLPLQEADKVEIDLSNAMARLRDAQIRYFDAQSKLGVALGTPLSDSFEVRSNALVRADWPWRKTFATAPFEKIPFQLESVPAWRVAKHGLSAEELRESRDFRTILPSIDSSFSYGRTFLAGGTGTTGWTGVISVSIPLFSGLRDYSAYRAQSQVRRSAELRLEQTDRDARAEWEAARRSFKAAYESAATRERTLGAARRLYRDNFKRFQAGRISANDLIVDQNRLFDSELLAIDGWASAHTAYTRLCHSLGRSVFECDK